MNKEYDAFIAYHGTYEEGSSKPYADKLYEYLTSKGLKCFYFPAAHNDAYKANIFEVIKSKTFVLVCTNKIHTLDSNYIDSKSHFELATEINTFYALAQAGLQSAKNAKVLACGEFYQGKESRLHELFANRVHIYEHNNPNAYEDVYKWVTQQIKSGQSWLSSQISNEIKEVFSTKASIKESIHLDELIANAKNVKAAGISNTELTLKINPDAITRCIENGGLIELLFLAPEGKYTSFRETEEQKRVNSIRNITQVNIGSALDMKDALGDKADQYKIYVYDLVPRMNMIFVDDLLILQYYANNIPGLKNPAFLIKKTDNSPIYNFCLTAYNYIKSKSIEYKE